MKTGVRIVPNPKPEKKVRIAVKNAATTIKNISMKSLVYRIYSPLNVILIHETLIKKQQQIKQVK